MTRNALYFVVGALAIGVAVLGYMFYQERQTTGVEIKIGNGGVSIEKN
jgi:RsiW-degrading membrane proteinase PrsW (M82 family)